MAIGSGERPLTGSFRPDGEAPTLAEYERAGGYEALRKALATVSGRDVINIVKESNLKGRGGAGFSTGVKWSLVPPNEPSPGRRYLVCNADEMEPGSFKDRILIEGNPHKLLEGMILAAYAIEADVAYVFLRFEYQEAARRLTRAINESYEKGYLGKNILGSGYDIALHLHVSAGRYICGEETALLNSLEGKRAIPRSKPPYPQTSGLWGRPTVVNNVETLCNVPGIVLNGAKWFKGLSITDEGGTKIYGVSGRVKSPGWWELPMGTSAREVIYAHAGGMRPGFELRAVIPGGASTEFLTPEHLDVRLDFASVKAAGSRLGTGTMIILDDKTCVVGMLQNLESFFARESCGWCTPCREGLPWTEKLLAALETGSGTSRDLEILSMHTRFLGPGHTFCSLAPGAMEPLQSALKYFRRDFELHVGRSGCPWKDSEGLNAKDLY